MSDTLKDDVGRLVPDLVAWRRDLHRHPELGFEEHRTAGIVAAHLKTLGLDEVRTGVGKTGVVGVLKSSAAKRPPVLLRADMDALPVHEVEGREYGSASPGKMHACGHDGHTAMLMGAARILASWRKAIERDVVFCFQPAEEGLGGAEAMIADGVLRDHGVAEAYGLHLWSLFPEGTIQVRSGPTMAATDEFHAVFHGKGGHGAAPHLCVDPILAAAQGLTALQSVVARSVDPLEAAVVSVGCLHGGTAPNVVPETATMHGTSRSFTEETRRILRKRIPEVLHGAASGGGCALEFRFGVGFPPVVNDAAAVERVRRAAAEVVGHDKVVEPAPMAAAEDFAFFLREVPGAFVFVGAGNVERGIDAPHHAPSFDLDEGALPRGVELLVRLALG